MPDSPNPSSINQPECDGLCVDSSDIGVPGYGIAYAHPGCPLHAADEVCGCGTPDRCLSPTHGRSGRVARCGFESDEWGVTCDLPEGHDGLHMYFEVNG